MLPAADGRPPGDDVTAATGASAPAGGSRAGERLIGARELNRLLGLEPTRRHSRWRSSRRRSRRRWSSPAPARARPRRWPPAWSGSSRTGWSRPTQCSASRSPARRLPNSAAGSVVGWRSGASWSSATARTSRTALPCCSPGSRRCSPTPPTPGRLVAEHALRIGAEPDARLISPAVAWQLADAVSRRYPDELPVRHRRPVQHPALRAGDERASSPITSSTAEDVAAFCSGIVDWFETLPPGRGIRSARPGETGALLTSLEHRARPVAARAPRSPRPRRALPAVDFADQMRVAARAGCRARGAAGRAGAVRRRPARRVPGHRSRTGRDAARSCSATGTRSPRWATRCSRSMAGAGASAGNIAPVRDDLPDRRRPTGRAVLRSRRAFATTG